MRRPGAPRTGRTVRGPCENRGLGRVEVLGFAIAEQAAAEADRPAARVADREDDAFAQAVVAFAVLFGDQAGLAQQRDLASSVPEHTQQVVPAGRA